MPKAMKQLSPKMFPKLLTEIPDPPEKLFVKGTFPRKDTKFLCVVGSRKYSTYGKDVCEKLIAGLSGYNISIVSGLALGMDAIAHRAALQAGLHTIAVPGSGLSPRVLYPSSNKGLAETILNAGGALISEFEPDFRARPESFPQRNRVMAGMSHATLVIEALERSGTLITARLATDYNRDVLTVPHSIFSKSGEGPHRLLRLGAIPITKSENILEALQIEVSQDKKLQNTEITANEQKIILLLQTPLSREEMFKSLPFSTSEINMLLSAMEIKGLITERMGMIHLS